jgi:hypothetical protein
VLIGMLNSNRLSGLTAVFLATPVLTSATGFLFPFDKLLPSHIVGIISLVVLAIAIVALYVYRLAGAWRCDGFAPSPSPGSAWRNVQPP